MARTHFSLLLAVIVSVCALAVVGCETEVDGPDNVSIATTFTRSESEGEDDGECVAVAVRSPAEPGPPPELSCMVLM